MSGTHRIKNEPIRGGDIPEIKFVLKAMENGMIVCRPLHQSCHYDFIVDHHGGLFRIQVKSSSHIYRVSTRDDWKAGVETIPRYKIMLARGADRKISYSKNEADFVAAYIVPEDKWYILPVGVIGNRKTILFCPSGTGEQDRWRGYMEAWHLINDMPVVRPKPYQNKKTGKWYIAYYLPSENGKNRQTTKQSHNGKQFKSKEEAEIAISEIWYNGQ